MMAYLLDLLFLLPLVTAFSGVATFNDYAAQGR